MREPKSLSPDDVPFGARIEMLPVEESDKDEILALFKQDEETKKIWGSGGGQSWYWYWHKPEGKQEYWVKAVVSGHIVGFIHWSVRKRDNWRNLQDVIVHKDVRGRRVGKQLVDHIGAPVYLKTDHDSLANSFYQRWGFRKGETVPSRNGKKLLTYYYREVE